ncbi:MAG: amidase family protein, partial [Chthonomonadales bacterium]
MSQILELSAFEIASKIKAGELSATEVTLAAIAQIEATEPKIKAYLTVTRDSALSEAEVIDRAIAAGGPVGPLAGVPVALKDNLCTNGIRTTAGSKILDNFIPPYDATVVQMLHSAGAISVGKANCDEFAMGSSTENSGFGPSRNPWNTETVPGGSSGGSAAAVAAGSATIALGSDTGGSIRQPASLCGVVGMKPTYGLVSRYGLIAYASSLDQIGPFSRTVKDTALTLNAIVGYDPHDSTSLNRPAEDYTAACQNDVKGLRIGIPKEFFGSGVTKEVSNLIHAAIKQLCDMGATAEECSLPTSDYSLASSYIIAPAEASSNLARFD